MSNDTEMADAPAPPEQQVRKFKQRIRMLPGATTTAASFEFTNEDHTLGNALRHVIMKDDRVEFCGYSIPHPSDPKMNLRIQTWETEDHSVTDVLDDGLQRLIEMCDAIEEKFSSEREKHGRDDGSEI